MTELDFLSGNNLMPSQYFDPLRPQANADIRRLMLAVLEDAIRLYRRRGQKLSYRGVREVAEAATWLMCDAGGTFSFNGICEELGFDAPSWRERLRTWDGQLMRRAGVQSRTRASAARARR